MALTQRGTLVPLSDAERKLRPARPIRDKRVSGLRAVPPRAPVVAEEVAAVVYVEDAHEANKIDVLELLAMTAAHVEAMVGWLALGVNAVTLDDGGDITPNHRASLSMVYPSVCRQQNLCTRA